MPRGIASLSLAEVFVVVARQRGAGGCGEFGAAAFDEIAGLRNDALQQFEDLAHTSFTIDVFLKGPEKGGVFLDRPGRTNRPGRVLHVFRSGCHMQILHLFETESKERSSFPS